MSVLESPRLYFKGEISWDPIVTNNYGPKDKPYYEYDEVNCETVLRDGTDALLSNTEKRVRQFREDAVKNMGPMGNWNIHGTHRSTFFNTNITGCDLGDGLVTSDPVVKLPVNLTGMLVDLEPYGSSSSQLFFDTFRMGVDGGYRISAPRASRFIAREINFARNSANKMIAGIASVVWQTSFPKAEGLLLDSLDSNALHSLRKALESSDVLGLTVRFNTYRTIYFDDPALRRGSRSTVTALAYLQTKLKQGGFQPNPARSLLVGVIGLWRKGEPMQEPGDRALIQQQGSPVASAHALVNAISVTLDLSNSIMEVTDDFQKMNLGPLQVNALTQNGPEPVAATLTYDQYNRAAYETTAGIVTLPLIPGKEKLATAFPLTLSAEGTTLLSEQIFRAAPLIPNRYIDQGAHETASFQVFNKGLPVTAAVPLTMYTLDSYGKVIIKNAMTSDPNGVVKFPVSMLTPGITLFVPSFDGQNDDPSGGFNPQVNTYMNVRVLPADQEMALLPPTWANVYALVLSNWNAMAPCMDNWLRLDDRAQVKSYAPMLKKLTDPANFENFRYMPVTRDLTAGARTLLYRFLDVPDHLAVAVEETTVSKERRTPETEAPPLTEFARLSQSMRRPMDKE